MWQISNKYNIIVSYNYYALRKHTVILTSGPIRVPDHSLKHWAPSKFPCQTPTSYFCHTNSNPWSMKGMAVTPRPHMHGSPGVIPRCFSAVLMTNPKWTLVGKSLSLIYLRMDFSKSFYRTLSFHRHLDDIKHLSWPCITDLIAKITLPFVVLRISCMPWIPFDMMKGNSCLSVWYTVTDSAGFI